MKPVIPFVMASWPRHAFSLGIMTMASSAYCAVPATASPFWMDARKVALVFSMAAFTAAGSSPFFSAGASAFGAQAASRMDAARAMLRE